MFEKVIDIKLTIIDEQINIHMKYDEELALDIL